MIVSEKNLYILITVKEKSKGQKHEIIYQFF